MGGFTVAQPRLKHVGVGSSPATNVFLVLPTKCKNDTAGLAVYANLCREFRYSNLISQNIINICAIQAASSGYSNTLHSLSKLPTHSKLRLTRLISADAVDCIGVILDRKS